jgi:hypothetical protein
MGISTGTNCVPVHVDLILHGYQTDVFQRLFNGNDKIKYFITVKTLH